MHILVQIFPVLQATQTNANEFAVRLSVCWIKSPNV